jgi:GTP-binding protein LepA
MEIKRIRNFSIIAHIDHGKSTLADRLLEVTGTIEARKMREQVLDSMELERERGITIKMQPVRMKYKAKDSTEYELNLIDTPGHIDFSYEVSRAQKAVEGALLLVDATQGVQAQTLTTLAMARDAGLVIIPVVNKIDSPLARISETNQEICKLLSIDESDIIGVSGKTGENVDLLLEEIVRRIPAPKSEINNAREFRSLVFDFQYSNHRGVIVYVRVMDGEVRKGDSLIFKIADEKFNVVEVGIFAPDETPVEVLGPGEPGYIVTGIKQPGIASVGDTVSAVRGTLPALPGYQTPVPVVWASIYPESQDDLELLRQSLGRLRLSDSSFTYEEESSGTLGRGFRCGFLGMLHLEIITERLKREFSLNLIVTTPSITYEVTVKNGKKVVVYSPAFFPEDNEIVSVMEPWVRVRIITPQDYLSRIMQMLYDHEATIGDSESWGDNRSAVTLEMPLRELMRGFFDELKSVSSGYASISYEMMPLRPADVLRMDVLVADEPVIAFTRIVARRRVEEEAEATVEKLFNVLPKQLFTMKIQAKALGRIISSRTLTAMSKDVTGYLYGGDRTRKMKLWKQQKEGKKRLKESAQVNIPQEVFVKMMKLGD